MNKKTILIILLVIVICALGVVLYFVLKKNEDLKGSYYVKIYDGKEPGSTYTLKIDIDGNYSMNEHFTSFTGPDEVYEKDTSYTGKLSNDNFNLVKKLAKKIDSSKDEYALYYVETKDNNKNQMAIELVESIAAIDSEKEEWQDYGKCLLEESVGLDSDKFYDNYYDKVEKTCRVKYLNARY